MKNIFRVTIGVLCFVSFFKQSNAQADISGGSGHAGTNSAWYCGWDNTTAFDLNIEHQGAYNINFYTSNTKQMTLTSGGWLGIGTPNPLWQTTIHSDAVVSTGIQFTNGATGITSADGFVVGVEGSGSGIPQGSAVIRQRESNNPMIFFTRDALSLEYDRMILLSHYNIYLA